MNGVNFLDLFC